MVNAFYHYDHARRLTTYPSHRALAGSVRVSRATPAWRRRRRGRPCWSRKPDAHQPNTAETALRLRQTCFSARMCQLGPASGRVSDGVFLHSGPQPRERRLFRHNTLLMLCVESPPGRLEAGLQEEALSSEQTRSRLVHL